MHAAEAASAHRALSDEGRLRLFTLVSERNRPLDVPEMAGALDLHPNTIRSHLRRLEAVGLVVSETEVRSSRGRPRLLFTTGPAAAELAQGARDYRLLASMLAGHASSGTSDPRSVAETTGRRWGGYLVGADRLHPSETPDAAAFVAMIARMMQHLGFAPEIKRSGGAVELHLHNCPFREVAERYPDVVCALHLGILQGALEESAGVLQATDLQPFVTPSLCVARLAKR